MRLRESIRDQIFEKVFERNPKTKVFTYNDVNKDDFLYRIFREHGVNEGDYPIRVRYDTEEKEIIIMERDMVPISKVTRDDKHFNRLRMKVTQSLFAY